MIRHLTLTAASLLAAVASVLPGTSSATFTATTTATTTIRAASDWTPPTVSVRDPGSPVRDTVTLTADATDGEGPVSSVALQIQASGSDLWTTLCTDNTAPFTCSWATRSGADGAYAVRARATDGAGNSTTSSSVSTVVANNILVLLDNPGDLLRSTVPLSARAYNTGLLALTLRIEYVAAGGSNWKTACTGISTSLSCSWNSASTASGDYDFRAVALVGTTTYTSAVATDIQIDNTLPTVTMTDLGTPLRGAITLAATAADTHSGVATVAFQYAASGSSTWLNACTAVDSPWTCRFDTTAVSDGTWSFRAVATDAAGNTATSATITGRVIDNTVSSISVDDPGAYLSGTVTIAASAYSSAGIASVVIQRAPSGSTTWADLCTDAATPYSCSWATTTVPDGLYDLRAVLTDTRGATTTSAVVTGRRVDNSPLRALDVQTVNGGPSAGKLDAGDQLTYTWSSTINLATVSAGWDGSAIPVTLRLRDGNLLGLGNKGDSVDVLRNGAAVNLGSVNLRQEYAKSGKTITFNATMTATTATANGVPATTVTIVLGTVASGSGLRGGNPAAMTWTPSTLVTDTSGRASAAAPATETGALDRDF